MDKAICENIFRGQRERPAMSEEMCAHGNDATECWTCEQTRKRSFASPIGLALTDDARLAEIRADALSETYGGELDFSHVSLSDVLDWMRIMSPIYTAKVGWSPLADFDVNSILRIFEEWTQGKHDAELNTESATSTQ